MLSKIDDCAVVGGIVALISVAVCVWLEIEPLPGFVLGGLAGASVRFALITLDTERADREALMWDLVSLNVAEKNGWDVDDYGHGRARGIYDKVSARSDKSKSFYDMVPMQDGRVGGKDLRHWLRGRGRQAS